MGFGFNLLFVFILIPLTIIFSIIALTLRIKRLMIYLACAWGLVVILVISAIAFRYMNSKMELDKENIYGDYIIDRSRFKGKQADWQYNHFRFTITNQDKLIFSETENEKVLKTSTFNVRFLEAYKRPRLSLDIDTNANHIIRSNPTLYRTTWNFYYVFKSDKFGNVFFKKGIWKPINRN